MNRGYSKLFLIFLAGTLLLPAGFALAWGPPQQQAAQQQQKQDPAYTEEEYDACMNATKEPDLGKRAQMIVAFLEKYPKSQLRSYAVPAYASLLFELYQAGSWDKLEPAAEVWLKYFPGDLKTMVYIAESAQKLGHDQKFIEYGEKIFAEKPEPQLGLAIYQAYQKLDNKPKQEEWALKLMEFPEFNDNFEIRLPFVIKYAQADNLTKAAEYAEMTLKALDLAKRPEATPVAKWNEVVASVRLDCSNIIAMNDYGKERYAQAVQAFEKVLKIKQSDQAYYYIGMCWWKLGDVSDNTTILAFLKAELLGGEFSAKAKDNAESLYKNNHGGNLTGIEKLKRRAAADLGTAAKK
jgi:tetratricopeptide (TPR) repeat protein